MLPVQHRKSFLALCERLAPESLGELTPEQQRVEYDQIMTHWRLLESIIGRRVSGFEIIPMPGATVRRFASGDREMGVVATHALR